MEMTLAQFLEWLEMGKANMERIYRGGGPQSMTTWLERLDAATWDGFDKTLGSKSRP